MVHSHEDIKKTVQFYCERLLLTDCPRPSGGAAEFVLKRVLNELIWKLSEADDNERTGKYVRCDTWSEEARKVYDGKSDKKFIFEHVVPRRVIVQKLLGAKDRSEISDALKWIRTCVVLKEEDVKLREYDKNNKDQAGEFEKPDDWWKRYTGCEIKWATTTESEKKIASVDSFYTDEGIEIEK
jgi:hypothetical protein